MLNRRVLRCIECGCSSDEARGWLAFLVADPEGEAETEAAIYCPACSHREFGQPPTLDGFY